MIIVDIFSNVDIVVDINVVCHATSLELYESQVIHTDYSNTLAGTHSHWSTFLSHVGIFVDINVTCVQFLHLVDKEEFG